MSASPAASRSPAFEDHGSSATPRVRVLICDDHNLLSDAMAMLIGMDSRLELLADPFERASAAIAAAGILKPDVVLMDVDLPGGIDGLEATRQITALSPQTRVVVMSGSSEPEELLVKAVEAGAAGFLPKTEAASKILWAIHAAASGESLIEANVLGSVLRRVADARAARRIVDQRARRLTERELEILQRVSEGESNEDIARTLFLSVHTVHTHVRNLLVKLDVHSKLQAVAWAVKAGIITVRR